MTVNLAFVAVTAMLASTAAPVPGRIPPWLLKGMAPPEAGDPFPSAENIQMQIGYQFSVSNVKCRQREQSEVTCSFNLGDRNGKGYCVADLERLQSDHFAVWSLDTEHNFDCRKFRDSNSGVD